MCGACERLKELATQRVTRSLTRRDVSLPQWEVDRLVRVETSDMVDELVHLLDNADALLALIRGRDD